VKKFLSKINHLTLLLSLSALAACGVTNNIKSSPHVARAPLQNNDVSIETVDSLESEIDDSAFAELMEASGLPSYDADVSCNEVLEDLRKKDVEILSIEKYAVVAQSHNMNFQMKYRFDQGECSERL